MTCEECKGACCEILFAPYTPDPDMNDWLRYHGKAYHDGVEFEARCKWLLGGKCVIHAMKPEHCKRYEVGSKECLSAIRRRRNA